MAPRTSTAALQLVAIADLRPTQFAVGFREIAFKQERYRKASPTRRLGLINSRPVPVVLGAHGRTFVLDRHHWLCALMAEGVAAAPTLILDDLSAMDSDGFWRTLQRRGWRRLYDGDGVGRAYEDMPTSLAALQDDPFRSLASALKRRGGFDKIDVPFSEFQWADRLRCSLSLEDLVQDFDAALEAALVLARQWAPASRWSQSGERIPL